MCSIMLFIFLSTGCAQTNPKTEAKKKVLTQCPDQWVTNHSVSNTDPCTSASRECFKINGMWHNVEEFENGLEFATKNCQSKHIGID